MSDPRPRSKVLALFGLAVIALAGAAEAASESTWRAELRELARSLVATHPAPFTKIGPRAFEQRLALLERELPRLAEEERVVRAMELVALLGDGHTTLLPKSPAFGSWYPFRAYELSDGYFVTSAHESAAELAGARILELGGRPVAEVAARARALCGADNAFGASENLYPLSNAGLMRGLRVVGEDGLLLAKLVATDGRILERRLAPLDGPASFEWRFRSEVFGPPVGELGAWVSAYGHTSAMAFRTADRRRPLHLVYRRAFVAVPLPEQKAYYVQVNFVADGPDESFRAFFQRVAAEVEAQRPEKLILDLRYNAGGDGSLVSEVLRDLRSRLDQPPWRRPFLLVGRKTFSAAVQLVDAFLDGTGASVVGEPAGAPLEMAGDPVSISFPGTGLELQVSTYFHHLGRSDDLGPHLRVDVPAPLSSADYLAGRDPAVDDILSGEEMRSLPAVAAELGGAAARRVYQQRARKHGHLSWWTAADEHALNQAGNQLRDAERKADALEVYRLNAEIHPSSWRAWENLGDGQLDTGDRAGALASYRRGLTLNPESEALRQAIVRLEGGG